MNAQDETSESVSISGSGGARRAGPKGGHGASIARGPGADRRPAAGHSAEDVADEATQAEQEAVDLGSELSFPASDPPAYMGAGAITGPPMRDEEHPQEPVISEGVDPHEAGTGGKP